MRDRAVLEADLEPDDRQAEDGTKERVDDRTARQRVELVSGIADRRNKKNMSRNQAIHNLGEPTHAMNG